MVQDHLRCVKYLITLKKKKRKQISFFVSTLVKKFDVTEVSNWPMTQTSAGYFKDRKKTIRLTEVKINQKMQ